MFKKLDRRHTGFENWMYYLNHPKVFDRGLQGHYSSRQQFFAWRSWCWATWGASKELLEWNLDSPILIGAVAHNEHWCWQNDNYTCRLYLRGDAELSHFLLRWS